MTLLDMIASLPLEGVKTSDLKEHFDTLYILALSGELIKRIPMLKTKEEAIIHCREVIELLTMMRCEFENAEMSNGLKLIQKTIGRIHDNGVREYQGNCDKALKNALKIWWPHCMYGKRNSDTDIYIIYAEYSKRQADLKHEHSRAHVLKEKNGKLPMPN